MTTYEKHLSKIVDQKFGNATPAQVLKKLIEMGVVDYTRCKVLAVRQYVEQLVKEGRKKTEAMWLATEKFICSFEYIRKCMYYYTDVNLKV